MNKICLSSDALIKEYDIYTGTHKSLGYDVRQYERKFVVLQAASGVTKEDIINEYKSTGRNRVEGACFTPRCLETVSGENEDVYAKMTFECFERFVDKFGLEKFVNELIEDREVMDLKKALDAR